MNNTDQLRALIHEAVDEAINDRFITAAEASRLIGVNIRTLNRMVHEGLVEARVIGKSTRFLRSEVLRAGREKYARR